MKEVLDTRFLTEYFYSTDTESQKKIQRKLTELVARKEGILPTIVMAEITKITCERRGKDVAESRYQALMQSGLRIQNLTPAIAKEAGFLRSNCKNIPMVDCIIAATAAANQARILTDDPHFDDLKGIKRSWI